LSILSYMDNQLIHIELDGQETHPY
jgi:hypothetical protein